MRTRVLWVVGLSCAFAGASFAGGLFLDFEDPETSETAQTPNPYHGIIISDNGGFGSDTSVMDINFYNAGWAGSLPSLSGDQVGWSTSGVNNISWDLPNSMLFDSGNFTPWIGFGPQSLRVHGFLGGSEVLTVDVAMVTDVWSFVNFGSVEVDRIVFENFGDGQWYLFDDISFSAVPAPGAIALFGIAALVRRRRR